jgi:hypothetical protein
MRNLVSVWVNRNGIDECYFEEFGVFDGVMMEKIGKSVNFCEGIVRGLFEVECEGDGWVMYEFDGIGVFEVREGYSNEKCKKEYDERFE